MFLSTESISKLPKRLIIGDLGKVHLDIDLWFITLIGAETGKGCSF
jgi:hypothetical protein